MFSQLLAGGRSTVLVAFIAGLVATVLSIVIGVTAGYGGRLADDLLSMLANFFLVLPALPLLIVIFGFLKTSQGGHDLLIGLVIAITGWAWGARVLRAQTLSLRNRDYVESARIIGERSWRIISFEILPNLTPIVASSFLFTVLYGVGTYTALAFLGLVNPEPLELGRHAVLRASRRRGEQRLLVAVHPARDGRRAARHLAGADQLRDRRVHQPAAAGWPACRGAGPARPAIPGLPKRFVLGVTPVPVTPRWLPPASRVPARPARGRSPATAPRTCSRFAAAGRTGAGAAGADSERPAGPAGAPLLDVRGLCADYGAGPGAVHAVRDADLVLHRGEVLGLAGESGSGKSTLAYAITRLLRAPGIITGGSVRYHSAVGPAGRLACRRRAPAPGAALVADLGSDAERHERAQPGDLHRLPAHRRAAGTRAGT